LRSLSGLGAEIECYDAHNGADRRVVHETEAARGKDEGEEKELGGLRFAIIEDISQKPGSVYLRRPSAGPLPRVRYPPPGGRGARGDTLSLAGERDLPEWGEEPLFFAAWFTGGRRPCRR